ncbi:terpene synthase family protein [Nocardia terpenica]|uniref:terpene synthase family protein n=1 Tax=Nocardia terpenica TaxID=455432 RepID=UPI0012FE488C|nr:hypothetical protein [Nocardia terpenica]
MVPRRCQYAGIGNRIEQLSGLDSPDNTSRLSLQTRTGQRKGPELSIQFTRDSPDRKVPPLWCPIQTAIHPEWRRIDENSTLWLERYQIPQDDSLRAAIVSIGAGRFGARFLPHAQIWGAQVIADFWAWVFAFDTVIDEGTIAASPEEIGIWAAQLTRQLETASYRGIIEIRTIDPFATALLDILHRLLSIASPILIALWIAAFKGSMLSWIRESANRKFQSAPNLNDYAMTRIESTFVRVALLITAAVDGAEVSALQLERPSVRALTEMCSFIMGIDNDIISFAKEREHPVEGYNNIVDILQVSQSSRTAINAALAIRDRTLRRFLQLRSKLHESSNTPLRRYLDNLASNIRGNIDASFECPRYTHSTEWPIAVADNPTETSNAPLNIPTVEWWWKVDP